MQAKKGGAPPPRTGIPKTAPFANFSIGAHAQAERFTLLTREVACYRTSFPPSRRSLPDARPHTHKEAPVPPGTGAFSGLMGG